MTALVYFAVGSFDSFKETVLREFTFQELVPNDLLVLAIQGIPNPSCVYHADNYHHPHTPRLQLWCHWEETYPRYRHGQASTSPGSSKDPENPLSREHAQTGRSYSNQGIDPKQNSDSDTSCYYWQLVS